MARCSPVILGAGQSSEVGEEGHFVPLSGIGGEEEVEVRIEAAERVRLLARTQ